MAAVAKARVQGPPPINVAATGGAPLPAAPSSTNVLSPASAVSTPTSAPSPRSLVSTPTSSTGGNTTHSLAPPHPPPHPHQHQLLPAKTANKPAASRTSLSQATSGPFAAAGDKMSAASVISPMPRPAAAKAPISMTSKEWVIPPRPKPGRKPATDTPPTKRKAQNRAAQRAFRERRAARVGELEEQLEAEKEQHDKAQQELRDKVHHLEMDAQALQSRCEVLENMLDKEKVERAREVEALRRRLHEALMNQPQRQQSLPSVMPTTQHTFAPTPLRLPRPSLPARTYDGRASRLSASSTTPSVIPRPGTTNSFSISQIISPPEDIENAPTTCGSCDPTGPCACAEEAMASLPVGCGKCTLGSRCECLEEVLNSARNNDDRPNPLANPDIQQQGLRSKAHKRNIRSVSPSSMAPDEKRQRNSQSQPEANEVDFTAMFSKRPARTASSISQAKSQLPTPMNTIDTPQSSAASPFSVAPVDAQSVESPEPAEDRCGFCEPGTYCVCADATANAAAPVNPLTLPAINTTTATSDSQRGQQTRTPPPSEGDAVPFRYEIMPDGSVRLPGVKAIQARNQRANAASRTQLASGGCGSGGPGTCAQCLADPKSGLFCRSLAANFKKQNGEGSSDGCCGGGGSGGCCKNKALDPSVSSSPGTAGASSSSGMGLSLSCADAYKTLSSHRHFNEAADDIGSWLPLLKAAPKPREPILGSARAGSSRTPMEVEAASIMSVLKGFDVRFGRGE